MCFACACAVAAGTAVVSNQKCDIYVAGSNRIVLEVLEENLLRGRCELLERFA